MNLFALYRLISRQNFVDTTKFENLPVETLIRFAHVSKMMFEAFGAHQKTCEPRKALLLLEQLVEMLEDVLCLFETNDQIIIDVIADLNTIKSTRWTQVAQYKLTVLANQGAFESKFAKFNAQREQIRRRPYTREQLRLQLGANIGFGEQPSDDDLESEQLSDENLESEQLEDENEEEENKWEQIRAKNGPAPYEGFFDDSESDDLFDFADYDYKKIRDSQNRVQKIPITRKETTSDRTRGAIRNQNTNFLSGVNLRPVGM